MILKILKDDKMNYLVGDIGNTSTKLSILNENFEIKKIYSFETKKLFKNTFINDFLSRKINNRTNKIVLFSSVVPKAFKIIKKKMTKKRFKVYELKDLDVKKILKIKIKNYNQLGSDRISNALGAFAHKNCLIIDFGTATTFDIIKNRIYDGGVISPGVNLSILNLNKSTALLPLFNLKSKQKNYGKNTMEALNAGFIWGYEGLINNIIKRIFLKSKVKFKIILTGGYANLFKKHIKYKTVVDENITINGIAKAFKELI